MIYPYLNALKSFLCCDQVMALQSFYTIYRNLPRRWLEDGSADPGPHWRGFFFTENSSYFHGLIDFVLAMIIVKGMSIFCLPSTLWQTQGKENWYLILYIGALVLAQKDYKNKSYIIIVIRKKKVICIFFYYI